MRSAVEQDDFRANAARARKHIAVGVDGLRETQLSLDDPPLRARAHIIESDGLTFVRGENRACDDRVMRGEHDAPLIAIQILLRGSAALSIEGLDASINDSVGELALYVAPTGRSTVRVRAGVTNEGFRILFSRAKLDALAMRFAPLQSLVEHAAFARSFIRKQPAARDLQLDIATLMASSHLGALRPMFLEARALEWLARLLAARPDHSALPRRELERVHAVRDILLAHDADPPTLGQLASMVGTNEFALKKNFKLVFGQPVYTFALAHRLERARRMLVESDHTLKEIAAAVGYAHASHFSTAFRHQFGVAPSAYRAAARR